MRMTLLYVPRRGRAALVLARLRRPGALAAGVLRAAIAVAAMATLAGAGQLETGSGLHSAVPAGSVVVRLQPSGADVSLLGLIECPEIEGARHLSQGTNSRVIAADGRPLDHFPRRFSFRITVSLRKMLLDPPLDTIMTRDDPQQFLLKLRFKLHVYHGLQTYDVAPRSVELIGVPADIPYDERVFRLNFEMENLPVTDRVVLQVLSPQDEPLTHFAFVLL